MSNEKYGHPIFYGAMVAEGIVAMIWAAVAMSYFGDTAGLNEAAAQGNTPAIIVNEVCNSWLGSVGAIVAIIGVVACPITSGDTAFRSMRLILADAFRFNQNPIRNRLIISIPVFVAAYFLCNFNFSTLWNYVGISNQVLATITLWTGANYLITKQKPHWMLSLPAFFLTIVCVSYFLIAPYKSGGLSLDTYVGYIAGGVMAILFMGLLLKKEMKFKKLQA